MENASEKEVDHLLDLINSCLKLRYNEVDPKASGFIVGEILKAGYRKQSPESSGLVPLDENEMEVCRVLEAMKNDLSAPCGQDSYTRARNEELLKWKKRISLAIHRDINKFGTQQSKLAPLDLSKIMREQLVIEKKYNKD